MERTWTDAQKAAMLPAPCAVLVSAAAGSGKTSVLTERVIRLLTDADHPLELSRMLIVTFTRAAAAEMKSRIASALTHAIAKDPGNERLSGQLLQLGSAQICTIDSFFQQIVHANFERLNLPASFRIVDDSEIMPISLEVMEDTVVDFYNRYAPASPSPDVPFDLIRENPFAAVMDHLMSNRSDGKIIQNLIRICAKFNKYPEGIRLLHKDSEALRRGSEQGFLTTAWGKCVKDRLGSAIQKLKENGQALRAITDALLTPPGRLVGCMEEDEGVIELLTSALQDNDFDRCAAIAQQHIFSTFPSVKEIDAAAVRRYHSARNDLRALLKKATQTTFRSPESEVKAEMLATAEASEMLYLLFSEYSARMMKEKIDRCVLEFDDVRSKLYSLLTKEDGSPTPFALSLQDRYDAVCIDEYQDVDFMQDRIFALIGTSRRFMVGDIKQCIYKFRGSEPSIFADYRKRFPLFGTVGDTPEGYCVFMSENFRCDKPIVDFTNAVCSFLFSACRESIGYLPSDDLKYSKPGAVSSVPVELAVFEKPLAKGKASEESVNDDAEEEIESSDEAVWVAGEISRLLREERLANGFPIRPTDITILVRDKKSGQAFAAELDRLGIPASAPLSSGLLHAPLTTELVNLMETVDNPYRDIPLSELLQTDRMGFLPGEVERIRSAADSKLSLFDALESFVNEVPNDPICEKIRHFLAFLDRMQKNASTHPADRFLHLLSLEERYVGIADAPEFLMMYDQARIYQQSSFCGLYGFLNNFKKLLSAKKISADGFVKAECAVGIMTIHHSKGLEYPVVFVCAAGRPMNKLELRESFLYHPDVGMGIQLYDRTTGSKIDPPMMTALCTRIEADIMEENIRTLYVALTRARERLYVTGTLSSKWETAVKNAESVTKGDRYAILGCRSFLAWILAACEKADGNLACRRRLFDYGTISVGEPYRGANAEEAEREQTVSRLSERFASIMDAIRPPVGEELILRMLPTKAAASKISGDLLDLLTDTENEEASLDSQIELLSSADRDFGSLLRKASKPSAAEIGTATHAFLQFCNYRRLDSEGAKAECDHLIAEGFLSPETVALLNLAQLERFRTSDLMRTILAAKKVNREQQFALQIPMSSVTRDPEIKKIVSGKTLFVQGSIDLLLETEAGELILVDFKTDRLLPGEEEDDTALSKRLQVLHGAQLAVYAESIRTSYGKSPHRTLIYSLPGGRTVDVVPDDSFLISPSF